MKIKKKPKLAALTQDPRFGGGVLASNLALQEMLQDEFELTFLFIDFNKEFSASIKNLKFTSKNSSFKIQSLNCIGVGSRWAFWEPGHYEFTLDSWRTLLKEFDYYISSSGTCVTAHPLALLNKKFTVWCATPFWEDRKDRIKNLNYYEKALALITKNKMVDIEKLILQKASLILPMSQYCKSEFLKIEPSAKIGPVCGYPIKINVNPNHDKLNIVLAIGRFSDPRKNFEMLIETWKLISQQQKSTKLVLIGELTKHQEEIFAKQQNTIFVRNATQAEKEVFLQHAKVLLITSFQEGLGITGLEAFNHKTPVISTKCGGVESFIINEFNGFLVEINDAKLMANKCSEILRNDTLQKKMGSNALKSLDPKFSFSRIKREIILAIKSNSPS